MCNPVTYVTCFYNAAIIDIFKYLRISKDIMGIKQINFKIPENLHFAAENYALNFGFRNIQELIATSLREKIFESNSYDNSFSDEEIGLIDSLVEKSIVKGDIISREELNKTLLK